MLSASRIGRGSIAWSPWSSWAGTPKPSAKPRSTRRGGPRAKMRPCSTRSACSTECAATAESDLRQRRFGLVLRLVVEPLLTSPNEKMSQDEQSELAMRFTRALLFTGADRDARRSVAAWRGGPQSTDDRLLRDLGDTYNRLEAYTLDVDVQRLRLKNNPSGSIAWLDARYALALAYFHNGRAKEAAQLIDSTSILHPELGGNPLHDKFIHLRQRLGFKP